MEKIKELIKRKEKELKVYEIQKAFDSQNNLHVLCKRESDSSYVVWTAYYTGEEKTSYKDFYN